MPDLVWIDGEDGHAQQLPHQAQDARVEPGRFAVPKRVVEIEAALHPLTDRQAFEVSDRHSILEHHRSVIGAQRQTVFRRHADDVNDGAASELSFDYSPSIAVSEAMQFPITNG